VPTTSHLVKKKKKAENIILQPRCLLFVRHLAVPMLAASARIAKDKQSVFAGFLKSVNK
jgi:hypothetical protein